MRVLVIESSQTALVSLTKCLKQGGFLVDKVTGTQKGLWMAKTNFYDIVILAIDPFEALVSAINKLAEESSSAFFVALVKNTNLEKRIILLEKGLDEVIAYPCSFLELTLKMRNLLRREKIANREPAVMKIDDLILDPENFTATRGDKEITLRRKEFDLLSFLFHHQGQVITKMTLLESVWDLNIDVFTNTLEVHILSLRRKIDTDCTTNRRLIHTVYGRGYLFGLRPSFSGGIPATASLSWN